MKKQARQLLKAQRLMKMKRYKRLGECNLCGDCCDNENCEYFQRVNGDLGICTVYGKPERFEKCLKFPEVPGHPFQRCGYWFADKHDGGKWIKPESPLIREEDFEWQSQLQP